MSNQNKICGSRVPYSIKIHNNIYHDDDDELKKKKFVYKNIKFIGERSKVSDFVNKPL